MKVIIFVAILISSVFASPALRIIGGHDAKAGEFPFAAAIDTLTNDGSYFYSGALLNNEWILTSGSCVDGALLFSISLGSSDLNGSGTFKLSTRNYILHPGYNRYPLNNDIGLIKFRLPITFTDYIQPVALPNRDVQIYKIVTAIGWGQTSDDSEGITNALQTVFLTAVSNEECQLYFGSQFNENMVCVVGAYNQGPCMGDTGSPLIQYGTVVGVSSFINEKGCESTDPSRYFRTFPYLDWIKNNTGL